MNYSLDIIDWQAHAPGLCKAMDWQDWAARKREIDPLAPLTKPQALPMNTARRLTAGSRLAVECGMILLGRHAIDAVLFTSRHGELERNFRILQALANDQAVSPTDFAMSVHNAAVGNLTILAKQPLVSSSLSAGRESFQQGLLEVQCLLHAGHRRILMVDFDGHLPDFYHPWLPDGLTTWPYAVGLVIQAGNGLRCQDKPTPTTPEAPLSQSLQFLQGWLSKAATFSVGGDNRQWCWSRT